MIQEAMERITLGRTCLIIAHRFSTTRRADRVIVLHRGEILEEGAHEELLARDGMYQRLYRLQAASVIPPALGALAIIMFMSSWNNFLIPLILMQEQVRLTVPVGLAAVWVWGQATTPAAAQTPAATSDHSPAETIIVVARDRCTSSRTSPR
jgi:hypothetical protein